MAGTAGLLLVSSLILFLGIVSKVIADRYEIPSVVFLLLFGITLGPEGVGVIDPEIFGEAGRSIIVSLSVAVIVFEGGFHLTLSKIRKAPGSTLRLVTVGALITLVGGGVATKYLVDLPWDVSFLISSLLVATGPTVITPVLSHVNVREGVRGILESEGIINDVSAAILAIVMFEVVVIGDSAGGSLVTEFVSRLGTGVVVGALAAGVTWYVLSIRDVARSSQNARLIVLGTAVLSFAVSETVATESGVAAVAVAGMLLGNADVPNKDEIAKFKGDITVIVLSVVFILLASLLKVGFILHLGLGGVLLVALLVLVVRPLAVMLSTVGSRFTLRERLFISGVGPRGIIPASIATFFAVELRNQPGIAPSTANAVVSVVFLVILVTVVFQAGGAPFLARKLNIIPMNIVVVGGGRVGREIAR
ncbi:MAG: sodium:proton antiporter, partial [Halobacteria archaeon]|nr:sodium:proton antiporter [Halobacteria archaeon]